MASIHITDIEAAINFWRERTPSPDGVTLSPELRALAEVYALLVFYRQDEAAEKGAQEKLAAGGVKFAADFPDADRKAFMDAAAVSWDELAKSAGPKAVAYRAQVLKALGR